jgi:hypothetical protein
MVLHHVPQLAGLVEIAPTTLDPHLLGDSDLDMINGVVIPVGGEDGVGETEGQQVHHRFLAQIVINTIDLAFGKDPGHYRIDLPR